MTPLPYTLGRLCEITGGTLHGSSGGDQPIREYLIDSRRLVNPEGTLFIALVTPRNDGHRYIEELRRKGVRMFMIQDPDHINPESGIRNPESIFMKVPDTLAALHRLAAFHREQFTGPVIGITGSNGKTIVKEWLYQLLSPDHEIVRSPRSFNSQIGVPLSVLRAGTEHDLAIFEAGLSQPGEMEMLEPMIRPTIGLITNIGHAHDEHFRNPVQKTAEKMKLFEHAGVIIHCSDYPLIAEVRTASSVLSAIPVFTWSRKGQADLEILSVEPGPAGTVIRGKHGKQEIMVEIPFTDEASVENAIHCWATMIRLGIPQETIAVRMARLTPIALRLELKAAINHCSLINDTYNSDMDSFTVAVDFLLQQNQHPGKTVIMSDLLQSGRDKEELYRDISDLLQRKKIDSLIGIGKDISKYAKLFPMEGTFFATTDEFLARYPLSRFRNEAILLKGARLFEFEKISRVLQQKAHETVLEVNLDAMVHNLNHYRSRLGPGVKTMAMVKAFSYGSGSFEIANTLSFHQVDYLAVAYPDEGVELRKAGITLPVMVMSPEEQSLDLLLKFNLEPEIYNIHILKLIEQAIAATQTTLQEEIPVHIKLDTGMHRLGFQEHELDELLLRLSANPSLRIRSVFTHLAASEDPAEDEFTRGQIRLFEKMSKKITQSTPVPVLRHVLNSAGISRFPEAQFDMVRIGIGLYGIGSSPAETAYLRNVSTLRTVVTQVRRVPSGDTIGYNRKGVAGKDLVIAVVPVGYADGLDRRLGNGKGSLMVNGVACPVIGNICMDLTMLDVTHLEERDTAVLEGDEVIVFGDRRPVTDLADQMGTIPYEVLTGISGRVKRIYFHE